jgi:hypothetical protein
MWHAVCTRALHHSELVLAAQTLRFLTPKLHVNVVNGAGLFNGACPDKPSESEDIDARYNSQYGVGSNHEVVVVGYDARGGIGSDTSYFKIKVMPGTWLETCLHAIARSVRSIVAHANLV